MAGSVSKRANGKWLARYRDDAKKEHSKTFDTKRDGQRWLDEVTTSQLTGRYVDPANSKITVRQYAELWRAGQLHRINTSRRHDTIFKAHVFPAFGDRPLGSIRPTEIQAWILKLSQTMKPGTVRVVFTPLKAMFQAAENDRVIASSPCRGAKLPSQTKGKIVPLTTDQVWAVEACMGDRHKALVVLIAGTGLRPGEAAGLTVDRVDFLRRTIHVDRQMMMTRPHGLAPLKTAASYREVPLPEIVANALSAHIAAFGTGPDGLLFTTKKEQLLNKDAFQTAFRKAFDGAGLPTHRAHDLRHYYASLLIQSGANVKVVQNRLGHATAAETLDTYAHMWPDQEDGTRLAIDSVLGVAAKKKEDEDGAADGS